MHPVKIDDTTISSRADLVNWIGEKFADLPVASLIEFFVNSENEGVYNDVATETILADLAAVKLLTEHGGQVFDGLKTSTSVGCLAPVDGIGPSELSEPARMATRTSSVGLSLVQLRPQFVAD